MKTYPVKTIYVLGTNENHTKKFCKFMKILLEIYSADMKYILTKFQVQTQLYLWEFLFLSNEVKFGLKFGNNVFHIYTSLVIFSWIYKTFRNGFYGFSLIWWFLPDMSPFKIIAKLTNTTPNNYELITRTNYPMRLTNNNWRIRYH